MIYVFTCDEYNHEFEIDLPPEKRECVYACKICGSPARRNFSLELRVKSIRVPMFFHKTKFKSKEEEEGTYGGRWV